MKTTAEERAVRLAAIADDLASGSLETLSEILDHIGKVDADYSGLSDEAQQALSRIQAAFDPPDALFQENQAVCLKSLAGRVEARHWIVSRYLGPFRGWEYLVRNDSTHPSAPYEESFEEDQLEAADPSDWVQKVSD